MELDTVNPADRPEWNDQLLNTDGCSFFHSANWSQVLSTSYEYTPEYFVLSGEGNLQGIMPMMEVKSVLTGRRGVSLAFTDYCEPIAPDRETFSLMLEKVIGYGRRAGWKYIDIRGGRRFLPDEPLFASYVGHTLALSENEFDMLSRYRSSTRKNILRSVEAGVEVRIGTNLQAVDEFYSLICLTRKRQGLPPQPFTFFANIYKYVISQNMGFVVLASHENTVVAGAVFFHFGDRALYKYAASDEAYRHLSANNLVMWAGIKWYSKKGYKFLDFGRTDPAHDGLLQFKRGWRGEEYPINYYRYNCRRNAFVAGRPGGEGFSSKLFRKMPIPMLRFIGTVLYRHMG